MRARFCLGCKRLLTIALFTAIFYGLSPAQRSVIHEPAKNPAVEQLAPRRPLITEGIDESKVTRRVGDTREVLKVAPPPS